MILRSLICKEVVSYFESEDWKELMKNLDRGKEIRHVHIYVDSILDPRSMLKVIEEYFRAHGMPLQRKIYTLPPGIIHGLVNIQNIHPRPDTGHCELIMRYSTEQVLAPMSDAPTRTGKSVEIWDDQFMEKHYAKYSFKTKLSNEDEKDLFDYFNSREWKLQYSFITDGENRHAHSMIETSIHPEIIQEFGIKAVEAKGWEVSKAVSVAFGMRGFDQGKIAFLLKKPEMCLELEWEFNPNVSIVPGAAPLGRQTTAEDLAACMSGIEYIELNEEAVQQIIKSLKARA